ncbi:hypothetical protein K445DRAFT_127347 [Daldinia sp. EC12]|nr:hypothetical protein F4774DRAFT_75812 [Daldinia eschscholtzii]OTB14788.1 hypothetical protein K445DRAFT_127347 [Daldinia sp. EC12]
MPSWYSEANKANACCVVRKEEEEEELNLLKRIRLVTERSRKSRVKINNHPFVFGYDCSIITVRHGVIQQISTSHRCNTAAERDSRNLLKISFRSRKAAECRLKQKEKKKSNIRASKKDRKISF